MWTDARLNFKKYVFEFLQSQEVKYCGHQFFDPSDNSLYTTNM